MTQQEEKKRYLTFQEWLRTGKYIFANGKYWAKSNYPDGPEATQDEVWDAYIQDKNHKQ